MKKSDKILSRLCITMAMISFVIVLLELYLRVKPNTIITTAMLTVTFALNYKTFKNLKRKEV